MLEGEIANRAAAFLQSRLEAQETLVDLMSLVYSAKLLEAACGVDAFAGAQSEWSLRLASLLERLRRNDGGYSKSFEGTVGSTYQTFLVLLCLELIGQPIPEPERIADFLMRAAPKRRRLSRNSRRQTLGSQSDGRRNRCPARAQPLDP